jgi:ribonuclease HII
MIVSTRIRAGKPAVRKRLLPNHRPSLEHERAFLQAGCLRVAGLDEAGRGAWAGPVVAAAVILNAAKVQNLRRVHDSKQLTPRQRNDLHPLILESSIAWGVGKADASEIDAIGVVPATRLAMRRAIDLLSPPPDALIVDALRLPEIDLPQHAFNFADSISLSVAAASILAKVTRDRMMVELETVYSGYGFDRHKGYGTRRHWTALEELGACPAHRATFKPVAAMVGTLAR